jgi:hypothetical protein
MELQLAVQPNSSAVAQFFSARRHSLLCCAFRKALGKPEEMGLFQFQGWSADEPYHFGVQKLRERSKYSRDASCRARRVNSWKCFAINESGSACTCGPQGCMAGPALGMFFGMLTDMGSRLMGRG